MLFDLLLYWWVWCGDCLLTLILVAFIVGRGVCVVVLVVDAFVCVGCCLLL